MCKDKKLPFQSLGIFKMCIKAIRGREYTQAGKGLRFFPPKSGKPSENIDDMPQVYTICAFFLHHREGSFPQDTDKHLSSKRFTKACCL